MIQFAEGANPTKAAAALGVSEWERESHAPMSRMAAESLATLVKGHGIRAIPVAPDTAFRLRTRTVTAQIEDEGPLDALVAARERLPGSVVVGVDVLEDKRRTKVVTTRSKKRITEWLVLDDTGSVIAQEEQITKAMACASKLARAATEPEGFHVRGFVHGEGSTSYATYRLVQTGRRVKLRITTCEATRKDPAPTGWVFFEPC